jgi:hypothetical protein
MIASPYRTTVTEAHMTTGKRIEPSLHNGRAKPGIAKHHQGKTDDKPNT